MQIPLWSNISERTAHATKLFIQCEHKEKKKSYSDDKLFSHLQNSLYNSITKFRSVCNEPGEETQLRSPLLSIASPTNSKCFSGSICSEEVIEWHFYFQNSREFYVSNVSRAMNSSIATKIWTIDPVLPNGVPWNWHLMIWTTKCLPLKIRIGQRILPPRTNQRYSNAWTDFFSFEFDLQVWNFFIALEFQKLFPLNIHLRWQRNLWFRTDCPCRVFPVGLPDNRIYHENCAIKYKVTSKQKHFFSLDIKEFYLLRWKKPLKEPKRGRQKIFEVQTTSNSKQKFAFPNYRWKIKKENF